MRNRSEWKPSKFVYRGGRLRASPDPDEVAVGSRLTADIVAGFYDRNLRQFAAGRLLDLGCGKVPLYEAYRDLTTDNVCVDWANTLHKNPYLDHELDLTEPLPFESGSFDTVILSDVLEHIPVPELLWGEMARVLAPGGRVIMNVPFLYQLHEQPNDYYRYTEFALRRFVDVSGLRLVKLEPTGGAPEVLIDIVAKVILVVPAVGRPISRAIQAMASGVGRTGLGRRVTRATNRRFPLGYFLIAERPSSQP